MDNVDSQIVNKNVESSYSNKTAKRISSMNIRKKVKKLKSLLNVNNMFGLHTGHILIKLHVYNRSMLSFVDTGSDISLVKSTVVNQLLQNNDIKIFENDINVTSVTNNELDIEGFINLPIRLDNQTLYHRFYVVNNAHYTGGLLLGSDFCHRADAKIQCGKQGYVQLRGINFRYELRNFDDTIDRYIKKVNVSPKCKVSFVKIAKSKKVKANSIDTISVSIPKIRFNNTQGYLIEDIFHDNDDFRIARSLYDKSNKYKFTVFCVNASNEDKIVHFGDVIAKAVSVDSIEDNMPELCSAEIEEQLKLLDLKHLNEHQMNELKNVLRKNSKVFSTADAPIGEITNVVHSLDIPEGIVSYVPQYRQPKACEDAIKEHVKDLLKYKIIKECESPYNSPILMVKKPDGSWRFCIDMRKLNAITPIKPFPIPKITDTVNKLVGMNYFSTLDAKSGYHHIHMKEEDKIKTAFRTNDNTFCFERMPFGLRNAGFTYQMSMNKMLIDVLGQCALIYIDDLIVFSHSFEEHLAHLDKVFSILIDGGVKLTMKKCFFAKQQVKYLGFIVDGTGIRANPEKINAMKNFPVPTNVKQIKQFLASVGFYRHMIEKFAYYSAPLSDLLKKNAKFEWSSTCQKNFDHLKNCLCDVPILRHPDFTKNFELHCDACTNSIAGVLMQRGNDDVPYPIAYFSRKLRNEELKYSPTEFEALAIIASIKNFHYYLYGREFTVVTDHMPLRTVFETKSKNARVQRWALFLQEYNFQCKYKSGKLHYLPDALSRNVACTVRKILGSKKTRDISKLKFAFNFDPVEIFSASNVLNEQMQEPRWRDLLIYLKGGTVATPPNKTYLDEFAVFENCLFYCADKCKGDYRLVIPETLKSHALFLVHDSKTAAHQGFIKTLHKARQSFYWPNMISDIKVYCRNCISCQRRKPGKKPFAPLGIFEQVETVLERVGVDLIGKMDETANKNLYILTVVDHFSRYTELFALKSKTAQDVSDAFSDFIIRHGHIKTLISDRGTEFLAEKFSDLCNQFAIDIRPTTSFNPKCNGLTEAKNKQIGDILHFLSLESDDDWDTLLPYVQSVLNGSYNPVIQNTSYYLFHGRDYKIPYNLIFNRSSIHYGKEVASQKLKNAFQVARENQQIFTEQIVKYYNKNARPHSFEIGDLVLVQNTTKSGPFLRKLNVRFLGPFRITDVLSEQVIKIADFNNRTKFYTVNVNRCKLFHSDSVQYPKDEIESDTELQNDNFDILPMSDADNYNNQDNSNVLTTVSDANNASRSTHPMTLRSGNKSILKQNMGINTIKQVRFVESVTQILYSDNRFHANEEKHSDVSKIDNKF